MKRAERSTPEISLRARPSRSASHGGNGSFENRISVFTARGVPTGFRVSRMSRQATKRRRREKEVNAQK